MGCYIHKLATVSDMSYATCVSEWMKIKWNEMKWIAGQMVIVLTTIELLHTKVVGINKTYTVCEGRFVDAWWTIFKKTF